MPPKASHAYAEHASKAYAASPERPAVCCRTSSPEPTAARSTGWARQTAAAGIAAARALPRPCGEGSAEARQAGERTCCIRTTQCTTAATAKPGDGVTNNLSGDGVTNKTKQGNSRFCVGPHVSPVVVSVDLQYPLCVINRNIDIGNPHPLPVTWDFQVHNSASGRTQRAF